MFYLLFKNGLPQDRDIVVSGEGADGVFGMGIHNCIYNWNNHKAIYRLLSIHPLSSLVKAVSRITGRGYGIINSINMENNNEKPLENPCNVVFSLGNYGSEDWVCKYFNISKKDIIENRYVSITQSIWSKLGEDSGKIIYYPFNDSELLNNAFSIKWEAKLKQPKNILCGVARDLDIPKFIIERRKSGFGIAPSKWANKGSVLDPLVPLASKCFDKGIIMNIQSIEPKSAMTFWNILNYSIWKRLCIDNEPLDILYEELSRSISDCNS